MVFKSEVLKELFARGFIKDCSDFDALDSFFLSGSKITLYFGADATAPSLHIGNLIGLMMARVFKKYGHNIIMLFGGATTKIGDPSFRSKDRESLNSDQIELNICKIKKTVEFIMDSESINSENNGNIIYVNNLDWLGNVGYLDFLSTVGNNFLVNQMLSLDSMKNRSQSLTFSELNYMILQAYDFYYLHKNHSCMLQIGGSDQWGNMIQGVNLIGKTDPDSKVFVLTSNLLTKSDGSKMGKSENGAIWLSSEFLSDVEYYQYWRNIEDEMVKSCLLKFSDLQVDEVNNLDISSDNNMNDAKKILAFEATKICRGSLNASNVVNLLNGKIETLDSTSCYEINFNNSLFSAFLSLEWCSSKAEFKRLIDGRAVAIDGELVVDYNYKFENHSEDCFIMSCGKKKKIIAKVIKK